MGVSKVEWDSLQTWEEMRAEVDLKLYGIKPGETVVYPPRPKYEPPPVVPREALKRPDGD